MIITIKSIGMKRKLIYLFTVICFLCLLTTVGRNGKNCMANGPDTSIKLKCQSKDKQTTEKENENDLLPPLHFFVLSI